MNDNSDIAFALDIDLNEDSLIDLTAAVDNLDELEMVIGGVLFAPDPNKTLEEYVERATRYLIYLLKRIRGDDLRWVSTAPLDEEQQRARISTLLHAANRRARA